MNWSLGVAPSSNQTVLITNAATKTVTIDSTTIINVGALPALSNLTVSGPAGSINTLYLNNSGTDQPLVVLNNLRLGTNGVLWVTNAAVQLTGTNCYVDGSMILDDGAVVTTNAMSVVIGNVSQGTLTVNGGTLQGRQLSLGGATRANGIFNMTGGLVSLSSSLVAGNASGSTGTVSITGGQLVITNSSAGTLTLGGASAARGTMTISNGGAFARVVQVGQSGSGTLTINTGTLSLPLHIVVSGTNITPVAGLMVVGLNSGSTGSVFVTGGNLLVDDGSLTVGSSGDGSLTLSDGQLVVTNGTTYIGGSGSGTGVGRMTVSNGTWLAKDVFVSNFGRGTLTLAGGTNNMAGNLYLGFGVGAGPGTVWLTGGQLTVTNAFTKIGYTVAGVMTVSNGTWLAKDVTVGCSSGGAGTLIVIGGTSTFSSMLNVGLGNSMYHPVGTVWLKGGQLTVTNASTVIGQYGAGWITVSNGTWLARDVYVGLRSDTNGLTVSEGTLTVVGGTFIADSVTMGTNGSPDGLLAHGFFTVTGGTVVIGGQSVSTGVCVGDQAGCTGTVNIVGGQFVNTNTTTIIGNYGIGSMTVSNSTVGTGLTQIGVGANSQGSLTIASNCTMNVSSNLTAGAASGATGMVMMTGGSLIVTNGVIGIGNDGTATNGVGVGHMTVSNGTVLASQILLGSSVGGQGDLTIQTDGIVSFDAAGTNTAFVVNDLLLNGGTLSMTNGTLYSGNSHPGAIIISNGIARCQNLYIGLDNVGSLTQAGGTMTVSAGATVGDCGLGVVGRIALSGGSLFVTNATGNATLDVRDGTVTLSGGLLQVDTLIMTNACGLLQIASGTLHYAKVILDPNLSALGDGIPNGWKQAHGLDALDPTVASQDTDGDGFSNLQEYLAGTDPTNSASAFRILSVMPTNNDVLISWAAGGGRTNVVQSATDLTGSYTNASPNIIVTGSGDVTTNYLDAGAATNAPARYYRIRLVP